jgi:sugar transferase EpsL
MVGKRIFDLLLSFTLLVILFVPMCVLWTVTTIALQSNGLFVQTRIGQHAKPFTMYKYKTLTDHEKTNRIGAHF